jgi:iron complex transport system ATP-binding protein
MSLWSLDRVSFRHRGAIGSAVDDVTLAIAPARITALLGPNGAGKSTMLQLLLDTLRPTAGIVRFRERPLARWSRQELAQAIGVVPQSEAEPLFRVREIVAMGRYPYLGSWQREGAVDAAAIADAMERCDVTRLADRWLATLSGGERQRVRIARALAQRPSVLVLDEPTASLDIRHEMATFELLRELRNDGATIVLATHNLNLAARYADDVALLHQGRLLARGTPERVMSQAQITTAYEWPVSIVRHADGAPQVVPSSRTRAIPPRGAPAVDASCAR